MKKQVKIESWSHCGGEWMHFGYFNTKEEADEYIKSKGYDPRYFREGL
jgi:hypothetical protein